jgi:hypothetical protein
MVSRNQTLQLTMKKRKKEIEKRIVEFIFGRIHFLASLDLFWREKRNTDLGPMSKKKFL